MKFVMLTSSRCHTGGWPGRRSLLFSWKHRQIQKLLSAKTKSTNAKPFKIFAFKNEIAERACWRKQKQRPALLMRSTRTRAYKWLQELLHLSGRRVGDLEGNYETYAHQRLEHKNLRSKSVWRLLEYSLEAVKISVQLSFRLELLSRTFQ